MMNRQLSLGNLRLKLRPNFVELVMKELTEQLYASRDVERLTERLYIQIETKWSTKVMDGMSLRVMQLMQMLSVSCFEHFMFRMKMKGVGNEKDELIRSLDIHHMRDTYVVQYEFVLNEFAFSVANKGCDISVHEMNDTIKEGV